MNKIAIRQFTLFLSHSCISCQTFYNQKILLYKIRIEYVETGVFPCIVILF